MNYYSTMEVHHPGKNGELQLQKRLCRFWDRVLKFTVRNRLYEKVALLSLFYTTYPNKLRIAVLIAIDVIVNRKYHKRSNHSTNVLSICFEQANFDTELGASRLSVVKLNLSGSRGQRTLRRIPETTKSRKHHRNHT